MADESNEIKEEVKHDQEVTLVFDFMRRPPDHVMAILLGEMGTRGTLDGQQRLVVRGRFTQKHFESLLRRYILDYVMCSGCKSTDAIISRENRLSFLRCEKCGSERPVAPIRLRKIYSYRRKT